MTPEHLPALVVAPKRVAESVWPTETADWRPDLTFSLAAGSPVARRAALSSSADVVALGRDNLADILSAPRREPFRTLVLDELSGFKSRTSNRWKVVKAYSAKNQELRHVWGLTGTPSPNGLMDLWAQIYLLDGGARLGHSITAFRNRFFTIGDRLPNGIVTRWDIRPEAADRIHELLDDICLSMATEGNIVLPPVTYNKVGVALPPAVRSIYKQMKRDLVADAEVLGGEIHTAMNAAVLTSKLSQIAAGFMYVDDADLRGMQYDLLHREKINAVKEVVEGTGSPVLVFYRFDVERRMLLASLDGAEDINSPGVLSRWDAGEVPVLVAHPASAGHGLNLQKGGHTAVWTSLSWSLEEWQQGNKRLARQGQEHPVVIHMIMAENTVDESIRMRLQDKKSVQDALLQHLESPL